jgi:hypothetical protein
VLSFPQVSAVFRGVGTGSSTELHTACAHALQRVPHQPTGYPQQAVDERLSPEARAP